MAETAVGETEALESVDVRWSVVAEAAAVAAVAAVAAEDEAGLAEAAAARRETAVAYKANACAYTAIVCRSLRRAGAERAKERVSFDAAEEEEEGLIFNRAVRKWTRG